MTQASAAKRKKGQKMGITGASGFLDGFVSDPVVSESGDQEIVDLSISSIYRPKQQRLFFDRTDVEKLKQAIQDEGFRGSVLVTPLASEDKLRKKGFEYELVYGATRVLACEELGKELIRSEIKELTPQQVRRIRFDENMVRKNLNLFEEILGYLELMADEVGVSQEAVERELNAMSNSAKRGAKLSGELEEHLRQYQTILDRYQGGRLSTFRTKLIKFRSLPADALGALNEGLINASKALEIGSIKDDNSRSELLTWVIEENPPVSEIRIVKRLRQKGTSPRATDTSQKATRLSANEKKANTAMEKLSMLQETDLLRRRKTDIGSKLDQINRLLMEIAACA